MKYVLVLFLVGGGDSIIPQIIEQSYPNMLACWNAGFAMKSLNPKLVLYFNCERFLPDQWNDGDQ